MAKNRAYQRLEAIAAPIAEAVKALPLPRIIVLEEREGHIPQTVWGAEDSHVKVWGLTSDGLTGERRDCFYNSWRHEQANKRIEVLYPRADISFAQDTDARKRWKLWEVIRKMLGV